MNSVSTTKGFFYAYKSTNGCELVLEFVPNHTNSLSFTFNLSLDKYWSEFGSLGVREMNQEFHTFVYRYLFCLGCFSDDNDVSKEEVSRLETVCCSVLE